MSQGEAAVQDFLLRAVNAFWKSEEYENAVDAQYQFEGDNQAIMQRKSSLSVAGKDIVFHKPRNNYFYKFIIQRAMYLLGNGVSFDNADNPNEDTKEKFGDDFDYQVLISGVQGMQDGYNYYYPVIKDNRVEKVRVLRGSETFTIDDEITGEEKLGIRAFKVDGREYFYIELYTYEDLVLYKASEQDSNGDRTLDEISRTPHRFNRVFDSIGEISKQSVPYEILPLIPVKTNLLGRSEWTGVFKSWSDLYDYTAAEFGDSVTIMEGLYLLLQNYSSGASENDEKIARMMQEIVTLKMTFDYTDTDSKIDTRVVEMPYEGKERVLELCRAQMYSIFMGLDQKELTGSSLTNVAINTAKTDLDLAADMLEMEIIKSIKKLMELLGIKDNEPKFSRRTLTNDKELVDMIMAMIGGEPIIDVEEGIEQSNVADDRKQALLERMQAKEYERANDNYPIEITEEVALV